MCGSPSYNTTTPTPAIATPEDPQVIAARDNERRRAALAKGNNQTILGTGNSAPATVVGSTVLGA